MKQTLPPYNKTGDEQEVRQVHSREPTQKIVLFVASSTDLQDPTMGMEVTSTPRYLYPTLTEVETGPMMEVAPALLTATGRTSAKISSHRRQALAPHWKISHRQTEKSQAFRAVANQHPPTC